MDKPNYYAILPATVRYSSDIRPMAKLLFAEITALSNKDGYCTATNGYFAKIYEKSDRSIRQLISSLQDAGFLKIEVTKNATGTWRKLYPLLDIRGGRNKNSYGEEQTSLRGRNKCATQKNNTRNNIDIYIENYFNSNFGEPTDRSEKVRQWFYDVSRVRGGKPREISLEDTSKVIDEFWEHVLANEANFLDNDKETRRLLHKYISNAATKSFKSKGDYTKTKPATGRPNSKTRDIQYIQNAKDTLLRVRGELVGNNTIQALEQKNILIQNESKFLNKLDHLTNIKLEYFKDNDCISEYFLFDLLYSNTFHYLRKAFRVIGDNVEDHILVKGTINKFKKKLFNELSDYNQSKGDIYKLAYKHHKKTQL